MDDITVLLKEEAAGITLGGEQKEQLTQTLLAAKGIPAKRSYKRPLVAAAACLCSVAAAVTVWAVANREPPSPAVTPAPLPAVQNAETEAPTEAPTGNAPAQNQPAALPGAPETAPPETSPAPETAPPETAAPTATAALIESEPAPGLNAPADIIEGFSTAAPEEPTTAPPVTDGPDRVPTTAPPVLPPETNNGDCVIVSEAFSGDNGNGAVQHGVVQPYPGPSEPTTEPMRLVEAYGDMAPQNSYLAPAPGTHTVSYPLRQAMAAYGSENVMYRLRLEVLNDALSSMTPAEQEAFYMSETQRMGLSDDIVFVIEKATAADGTETVIFSAHIWDPAALDKFPDSPDYGYFIELYNENSSVK